jgi:DNA (cytosine-5)-methyltransferase 1
MRNIIFKLNLKIIKIKRYNILKFKMVKFSCERCGKEFSQKSNYNSHNRRKTPCENNTDTMKSDNKIVEAIHTHITQQEPKIKTVKYIDLFCGMGSFHYSFQKLGFQCVMASDIYKSAQENYFNNYNIDVLGDICDIEPLSIEPYDILCAGFPCQPFSQAGHHKGFSDSRGTMFSQVMKFVKINVPKIVILENVQALLNHDKGKSFTKIKDELEKEGYIIVYKVLKCSDYGIPQMRKRLFIVGFKNIEVTNLEKFFELDDYNKITTLSQYLGKNFKKDIAYTLRCGGKHSPINDRHNWDGYFVDDTEYRLTIEDGLKLQGFYDYKFTGTQTEKWKMIGNTIPTIFTEIIGKQIIKHTSKLLSIK